MLTCARKRRGIENGRVEGSGIFLDLDFKSSAVLLVEVGCRRVVN